MKLEDYLQKIGRIDQLTRQKNTGSPEQLAKKLDLSKSTLYRYLDVMKTMGAPIKYSSYQQSFVYRYPVVFIFGFMREDLSVKSESRSPVITH